MIEGIFVVVYRKFALMLYYRNNIKPHLHIQIARLYIVISRHHQAFNFLWGNGIGKLFYKAFRSGLYLHNDQHSIFLSNNINLSF